MRINSKKPKGKKVKQTKKKLELSELAAQRPPCAEDSLQLIVLKYFSLPFTMFQPCGTVFIMNSKIHLRKNSSNEYFKIISHYFRVYSLSGFI